MPLTSIIIRAEGVLAGLGPLRMRTFERVFHEAGLTWSVDEESFARSRSMGSIKARMAHFVHRQLRGRPETQDTGELIAAMDRRFCKLFSENLRAAALQPRPCVGDLFIAAAEEGVTVGVISELSSADCAELMRQTLGAAGRHVAAVWTAPDTLSSDGSGQFSGYPRVAEDLRFPTAETLVVESAASGASAAGQAGFRTLIVRDPHCVVSRAHGEADAVFDDLSVLIRREKQFRLDPMTQDERSRFIGVLQSYMAGNAVPAASIDRSHAMRVSDILQSKGSAVKTIEPDATLRAFAHALKSAAVGAMVVQDRGGAVVGIISERDLARGIADFGAELPRMKVSELMTREVITCRPEDTIASVARLMTQRRIRHVPVVVGGRLVGLISAGDALARRLDEVQLEANVLRDYAISRR